MRALRPPRPRPTTPSWRPDDEDDSPRDPNPDEGWDDDGEVYDAYQDDDEGDYDDYEGEGEAEAACYGGAVIEDID